MTGAGTAALRTPTASVAARVANNIGEVIKGKSDAVRLVVTSVLVDGCPLTEDVPGVGKTFVVARKACSPTW